jgi:hypothetical protein
MFRFGTELDAVDCLSLESVGAQRNVRLSVTAAFQMDEKRFLVYIRTAEKIIRRSECDCRQSFPR